MTPLTEDMIAFNQADVKQVALSVPDQAKAFTVSNNDDYTAGESLLATCKQIENEIHATFDPIVDKAHQAHKEAVAQRKKYLDPIEDGRRILKGKMIAYQSEQERKQREEQARLEAEARKRAEDEALALAAQAEAEGDKETAEAIIAEPVQVAPVVVPRTAPAASRLSAGRSVWSAEVVSLMALVKAVAEGKQPITLIQANETALNGMARSLKSAMNIQGVRAVERKV